MLLSIVNLAFLIGAVLFVRGLSMLSSPETARKGNIYAGAIGMGLAILGSIFAPAAKLGAAEVHNNYIWILAGMLVGGSIGYYASYKVKMTAMPQMVAIFNGLGGATAVLLAMVEFNNFYSADVPEGGMGALLSSALALIIGGVAFTGSMIAFLKLEEVIKDNFLVIPKFHTYLNLLLLAVMLGLAVWVVAMGDKGEMWMAIVFMVVALYYGISFVVPIGGADMPVVIALLNTFSGLSAASAGLIYDSKIMVVGGLLVGASGMILTLLMCRAMNRSLLNVLIGGFGGGGAAGKAGTGEQVVKEVSMNDAAIQLNYSKSVVFVPGYGLAVAQAQKVCKEIEDILEANGVEVRYAIHPVAGRMPGHMNVLLAEADVPYPKLLDLDDANSFLANADIAVIVGANDVVNPAALDDPSSPIYGMPILRVWDAKHVIVLKRSMNPGYAGIQNPLFFHDRTRMLFGDAKDTLTKLVSELKSL
ncbi:MAG: NAD(P)(+) transhydrogenase (Re/Si-specific) subunit beta [Lewinellaceae bacterium]|nr:NAD(P)(+) transhydrogenase (Re/Si-specific) subunit beta [Lewinellaceae bacterium]